MSLYIIAFQDFKERLTWSCSLKSSIGTKANVRYLPREHIRYTRLRQQPTKKLLTGSQAAKDLCLHSQSACMCHAHDTSAQIETRILHFAGNPWWGTKRLLEIALYKMSRLMCSELGVSQRCVGFVRPQGHAQQGKGHPPFAHSLSRVGSIAHGPRSCILGEPRNSRSFFRGYSPKMHRCYT